MRSFNLTNPLGNIYTEAKLPAYKRKGLNWIMCGNLCGNLWGIICGSGTAAMVGLANLFGAGDFEFGLLVAVTQIAAVMQIPFSLLVNKTHKRKQYLLTWGLASRAIWFFVGLTPLIFGFGPSKAALAVVILILALSSIGNSFIGVCWFPWFSDIAPLEIRGRWFSIRDTVNSVSGLLFGLLVAYLLDVLPESSKFTVIFILGGLFGVMDMICFGFAKDEWVSGNNKLSFFKTIKGILKDKPFMRFTIMWTAWCFSSNMAGSYLTPYAMNSMGLSYMQITVFGTVTASLFTVIAIRRWGHLLDRFGSRNVMLLSALIGSVTQMFYIFSVPSSIWPTFLYNAVGALFWSGSNLAANGLQLSASSAEERPSYIAVFACITALAGTALGTLCGSTILTACETRNLFTGYFDRYKLLITIATVLRVLTVIIFVPKMPNENNSSVREMISAVLPRFLQKGARN